MSRKSYQNRLEELRGGVRAMSEFAREQFADAVTVLETGDEALAAEVIDADHELNERYLALEGDCIELLALQQPVAGDLRFIAASFKIITDLERIGDLAVNLAQYGREGNDTAVATIDLEALATIADEMVADAIHAYTSDDVDRCRAVAERDDELDARCTRASEAVVRQLIANDPMAGNDEVQETVEAASRVLLTIRDVERIGDHAVNTAARTLYMVTTDDELIY